MSTLKMGRAGEEVEFGVMAVPRRKSKALVIVRRGTADVVAYFCTPEASDRFEAMLETIVSAYEQAHEVAP